MPLKACRRNLKLLLLVTAVLLVLSTLSYRAKYECINVVKSVTQALVKKGDVRVCQKLQIRSSDECNNYQAESKLNSSDDFLRGQIIECAKYIDETKVEYDEEDEKRLPLAFSILAHKDATLLSKLIAVIFRPWNAYCIQLDSKSDPHFVKLIKTLVDCYKYIHPTTTIFISKTSISLVWQHSSLLEGDLSCLEQLLTKSSSWEFFVNVVGSEFPLITNRDLVAKLITVDNGIGFVDARFPWPEVRTRWKYSYRLPEAQGGSSTSLFGGYYKYGPYKTDHLKSPPPLNLTIMYGIKNVAITRKFAGFILHSHVGQVLRDWLQDTLVAVEHFFPTLATVVREKGSNRVGQDFDLLEELNSFKMRKTFWHEEYKVCHGEVRREICNLGFGDLPDILDQKAFVMNKFDSDIDSTVVDCLRSWVYGNK